MFYEKYGYRCWEPKGKKILRHCDVTFDEIKLYKDVYGHKFEITEMVGVQEKEFVETKGIDGRDVIVPEPVEQHRDEAHIHAGSNSNESENSQPGNSEGVVVMAPRGSSSSTGRIVSQVDLRKSARVSRMTPNRYSPSMSYLLLTDAGEPESYKEAISGS